MANLSQPTPGNVDRGGDEDIHLVHEFNSDIGGERTTVHTYSDGSRKVFVGGKLTDDVKVLSDVEKAELDRPTPMSDLQVTDKATIAAHHPDTPEEDLFTEAVKAPLEEQEPVLAYSPAAEGDLDEEEESDGEVAPELIAGEEEASEQVAHSAEGTDTEDVQATHGVGPSASEAELINDEVLRQESGSDPSVVKPQMHPAGEIGTRNDGPDADEHNEARDNLEAQNDENEATAAKSGDVTVDSEESDESDLTFKTVPELKALAAEKDIDLGKATKKDDIIAAIEGAE